MYDFSGKIAVITGAAKGIGAAIAEKLLTDGISGLAMLDIDYEGLKTTASNLDPLGMRTLPLQCDVSALENVEQTFKQIFERFSKVDILINNAGITRDAIFHKMTLKQFKKVIDVHLYGTLYCTQQVVPGMRSREYGKIVNISSCSAFGAVGQANYASAKAGIIGFTKTLAKELGRKNITVNSVAPGAIDTDMLRAISEKQMEETLKAMPMGRLGRPSEVAGLVAFLSSDDSSYVSGTCIVCSGGAYT